MDKRGGLAVYVTSHGYGHLNRAVAVLNQLAPDVPVTIRCHPNLFTHWGERLRRPATLEGYVSDVGTVHPPGESAAVDGAATLERAARVHAEAMSRVDEEAAFLRDSGISAVLCDAPPVPLVAARRAGVPGYLLANFTWADIYEPHARRLGREARALVADIRQAYLHATRLFRAEPGLRMAAFGESRTVNVGLVATRARNRRRELRAALGLTPRERLVYVYFGRYGQESLDWSRLEKQEAKGIHFVGFHEAPGDRLANLHVVPAEEWTGSELATAADVIVAKAGYGTCCEAMLARKPMIYPPRTGFAEHRALDRAMRQWGGGIPIASRDFTELRLDRALDAALALRPGPPPFPEDGARRVANHLIRASRGKGARRGPRESA